MNYKPLPFYSVLLSLFLLGCSSQSCLKGTMTYADGSPASGVTIELDLISAGTKKPYDTKTVTTDKEGKYLICVLHAPEKILYNLRVSIGTKEILTQKGPWGIGDHTCDLVCPKWK